MCCVIRERAGIIIIYDIRGSSLIAYNRNSWSRWCGTGGRRPTGNEMEKESEKESDRVKLVGKVQNGNLMVALTRAHTFTHTRHRCTRRESYARVSCVLCDWLWMR